MPKQVIPVSSARSHSAPMSGVARVAVVEHDRGLGEQHADEEVPHHPARGGEPEDAVALLRVDVQVVLLEVLDEDAALRVHDRLRQAGRARGVEDPHRVLEGHALERRAPRRWAGTPRPSRPRRRRGSRASPCARARASRPARARSARCGHGPYRRSGSRRRSAAPSARSGRSGRRRCAPRSRASSSTTPRRGSWWRGRRRSSRGCSACRRRRGRRARCPSPSGRPAMRAVCERSSSHVHSPASRSSEAWRIATRSPGLSRKMCSG